jgi:hypothetical protein
MLVSAHAIHRYQMRVAPIGWHGAQAAIRDGLRLGQRIVARGDREVWRADGWRAIVYRDHEDGQRVVVTVLAGQR